MKKILIVIAMVALMASPALADEPFAGTFTVYCYKINADCSLEITLTILTCRDQLFTVPVTVPACMQDAILHQLNSDAPQVNQVGGYGNFLVDLTGLPDSFEIILVDAKWGTCAVCPTVGP